MMHVMPVGFGSNTGDYQTLQRQNALRLQQYVGKTLDSWDKNPKIASGETPIMSDALGHLARAISLNTLA